MLAAGGRLLYGNGMVLRPYIALGGVFCDDDSWGAEASFEGAPNSGSFRSETELPEQVARLRLGFDLLASEQVQVKLEYGGELNGDYRAHSGTVRATTCSGQRDGPVESPLEKVLNG